MQEFNPRIAGEISENSVQLKRRSRTLYFLVIFVTSGSPSCSFVPSHIHDADRATRTTKLVGLVDQYVEKSPGIYDTLLKSTRSIAAEQDKVLALMAAARTEGVASMLPFQSGASLLKTSDAVCSDLELVEKHLIAAINAYLTKKAAAQQDAKNAEEAIKASQDKVTEAQRDITNWNAALAILEKAVGELPAINQSRTDSKTAGLATLQERIQSVADTEVQYVDGNGKTQKRKIVDIFEDQIVTKEGKVVLNIPDAPGATLTILMLGVDLARVEKQRAEAHLLQLSSRLWLYERVNAGIKLASALHADAGRNCQDTSLSNFIVDADTSLTVEAPLMAMQGRSATADAAAAKLNEEEMTKRIRTANSRMLELAGKLIQLRELAVAQSISTRAKMDLYVTDARLAHEETILDSQVNDVAWRTVIRSGVVVLDQYEQGGFSAQDAATIVDIAQTIALGVIAGRVN